jgi:arylsulfatase A-like enzyme
MEIVMKKNGAMRLRKLVSGWVFLLAVVGSVYAVGKPNVLFILVDDLGWADLGCQGSTFYRTPNIDQLAREGMRFSNAYAAPCCSPTRAAIMTGKKPARLHLTNPLAKVSPAPQSPRRRGKDWPWNQYVTPLNVQGLPLEEVTIAERLKNAGYSTAIFGKWHLGGAGFEPEKQGFDLNVGAGHYPHPKTYFSPYKMDDVIKDGPAGEYLTDRLTDEAIQFISADRKNPFFAYLSYYTVHTPIMAKPEVVAEYERRRDPDDPQNNATYAAMIDSLDKNIGRLMAALKEQGLDQDTLVVFVSDNGGVIRTFGGNEKVTSNLPLRSGKGTLFEGGIRVPMILRRPGWIPAGTDCSTMVDVTDFYQTFCELAGITLEPEALRDLDGVSLVPLMKNPSAALSRDAMCWLYPHYNQFTDACATIRKGNLKLLKFYGGATRLFDLNDDIGESRDLAPQQPERVAEMQEELEHWLREVDAWEMVRNPNYDPRKHSHGLYPGFDADADETELVEEWSFDEGTVEHWTALKKCSLSVREGTLIVSSTGYAAAMENRVSLNSPGTYVLQAKMKEVGITKGACVLFWKNKTQKQYVKSRRIQFAAPHDEHEHLISALFRVSESVDHIRFEPAMMAGSVEFDWIRIYKTNLP